MHTPEYVQQFDSTPQFWQFIRGLRNDDLIVELIQNDLDANATQTSISFTPRSLICQGDGEPVGQAGWTRLSYVMGAGDQVERKQFRIGVKNHGLKACFRLGDELTVRSNGRRMIQTLYKDGYDKHPSPGTLPEPVLDTNAPLAGCSVEVPYRIRDLIVEKGEPLTLYTPAEELIESLFRDAIQLLPQRLMGVVRPKIRDHYTLHLSHHKIGSFKLHWRAKRGRHFNGRGRRRFSIFSRECTTYSPEHSLNTTIHEQACIFRIPFPTGKRPEIPEFFTRDNRSLSGEIAWHTDKHRRPRTVTGARRYPIAYSDSTDASLTGTGVHFSAPFVSNAERHGTSQSDPLNDYLDNACRDALVEILAGYLIHRHGPKALQLYMSNLDIPDSDSLHDLIERTVDRRALPLARKTNRTAKRSKRLTLGPRRRTATALQRERVILPVFTWDRQQFSPLLSQICPRNEDQIDSSVPKPILRHLAENVYEPNDGFGGRVITFDENDVIERLQPKLEAEHFPWTDESEWQAELANPSVVRVYFDVALKTIQRGQVESEQGLLRNTYVAAQDGHAQPLADMFSGLSLPPNLGQQDSVPIVHQELQDHRLLKRRAWKPKPFTLAEYLTRNQYETASTNERMTFWLWLRSNWRTVKRETLLQISALPVWPGSNGELLTLDSLCEPRSTRVSAILSGAIVRPSRDLLRTNIVNTAGRGRLAFRSKPSTHEFEAFLSENLGRFSQGTSLRPNERRAFHRLERDLVNLVSSMPRLRGFLSDLSDHYAIALDKTGTTRRPDELVREDGFVKRLALLDSYVIDRPKSTLDRTDGWAPMVRPSADQVVATLKEDGTQYDAHVPRIREYVTRARQERVRTVDLIDVPCIPVKGLPHSPSQLALRGRRDFWGEWKIRIPVTHMNPEVQRLYKSVGVAGGEPDRTSSREFFRWLASRDLDVVARHADQVLRHINHGSGPCTWSDEFPQIPFILVESDGQSVRLVSKNEATKRTTNVVIPDFEQLEEAIRTREGMRLLDLAIVESRRVTKPINTLLKELGARTLSDYVGEPVQVMGTAITDSVDHYDFTTVLASLLSGQRGRQLSKRLTKLGLDGPRNALRSNWRERLRDIQDVQISQSVSATYRIGRHKISIQVDGKLDRDSSTLWIRLDSDLEGVFFDVLADHIFEHPEKYYGSVLSRAYAMTIVERLPLDYVVPSQASDDADTDDISTADHGSQGPTATPGIHQVPKADPIKDVPKPSPIPAGDEVMRRVDRNRHRVSRTQPASESSQIENLKQSQYAWHCQACVAGTEPTTLAPSSSYVEVTENRRPIMQAHHCDHVGADGARHAGNIILLCRYHHLYIGDAVTRTDIIQALGSASKRRLTFYSVDGLDTSIWGVVVSISPPQRQNPIFLFFTKDHADYWLTKAKEEALI